MIVGGSSLRRKTLVFLSFQIFQYTNKKTEAMTYLGEVGHGVTRSHILLTLGSTTQDAVSSRCNPYQFLIISHTRMEYAFEKKARHRLGLPPTQKKTAAVGPTPHHLKCIGGPNPFDRRNGIYVVPTPFKWKCRSKGRTPGNLRDSPNRSNTCPTCRGSRSPNCLPYTRNVQKLRGVYQPFQD